MNLVSDATMKVTEPVEGDDVTVTITYGKFSPIDSMRLMEAFGEDGFSEDGSERDRTITEKIKVEEDVQDAVCSHILDVDGIKLDGKEWSDMSDGQRRRLISLVPQLLFTPLLKEAFNRPEDEEKNE